MKVVEKTRPGQYIKDHLLTVLFFAAIGIISLASCLTLLHSYVTKTAINNQATGTENALEADLSASILGKDLFLNLNGGVRRLLGQRKMNDVVRLDNGWIMSENALITEEFAATNAHKLRALQDELAAQGIEMLYLAAPFNAESSADFPAGETDYTNESLDRMYTALDAEGVHALDLRSTFDAAPGGHYSYFYRTDHHWNAQGAFCAYTQIMAQLQPALGLDLPAQLTDPDAYTVTTYQDAELGSYGQRTGSVFAGGMENFDLLEPKFDTRVTNLDTSETGTFSDVLVDKYRLENDLANVIKEKAYDSVYGKALGRFENLDTPCDKKVLVVGDSMMKGVVPYLALTFRGVQTVDAYHTETTLTQAVLDEYQPDAVIFIHHCGRVYNAECFDFGVMEK